MGSLAVAGSIMFGGGPAAAVGVAPAAACDGTGQPSGYLLVNAYTLNDPCGRCQSSAAFYQSQGRGTYCREASSIRAELFVTP
ncbi:MAG: hypothetical protein ABW215_08920 [Kibdelosporangium sp.]